MFVAFIFCKNMSKSVDFTITVWYYVGEVIKMPTAKTRANRRYNEKTYDRIEITVQKGGRAEIATAAAAIGMSVNAFVKEAINEKIARNTSEK